MVEVNYLGELQEFYLDDSKVEALYKDIEEHLPGEHKKSQEDL